MGTEGDGEHLLRFNLVVNDASDGRRRQLMFLAPGIHENKNPEDFPLLRLQ